MTNREVSAVLTAIAESLERTPDQITQSINVTGFATQG